MSMKVKVVIKQKPNLQVLHRALDVALDNLRNRLEENLPVHEEKDKRLRLPNP